MKPFRVILVDEHPILLRRLAGLMSDEPEFQLVGMASSSEQALTLLERLKPDLAILDITMPDLDGRAVLHAVHQAALRVRLILLTATTTPMRIPEALALGIWGLLPRKSAPDQLVDCLRTVAGGRRWHPEDLRALMSPPPSHPASLGAARLTPREREIVDLVRQGMSNKAIAGRLGSAEGTVKIHLHNVFRKLKITTRTALAAADTEDEHGS